MQRITLWLWLALGGAVFQFLSLGTDFYLADGSRRDAWFGIPHTSDLILLSALVSVFLFGLTATGRNPLTGRGVGLAVGLTGLAATLQLGYRMMAPPFGGRVPRHAGIIADSCLYYCPPWQAAPADLLVGIWIAFIGCLAVALGGLAHAASRTATEAPAASWSVAEQPEMNPWLGFAALGAIAQFVFGYTFFTFYRTTTETGVTTWSGWLPTPHTSSLVLAVTVVVVGLVWAAARQRSPLRAAPLGALIATLGFVSATRVAYRILQPPFGNPQIETIEIGLAAYVTLLAALVIVAAGAIQAVIYWDRQAVDPSRGA